MNKILKKISFLILPSLLTFFIFRFVFLWKYWQQYSRFSLGDLLQALFGGMRFDLVAIGMTLSILGLFLFWIRGRLIVYLYFLCGLVWSWFFFISIVDLIYYEFSRKRISFEILTLQNDVWAMLSLAWSSYSILSIFSILCMLGGIYVHTIFGKFVAHEELALHWLKRGTLFLIYLFVFAILGRGGLQTKPITEQNAFMYGHAVLGHLALNPAFTTLRLLTNPQIGPYSYIKPEVAQKTIRSLLITQEKQNYPRQDLSFYRKRMASEKPQFSMSPKTNIVLIVWESLGAFITRLNPEADPRVVKNFNRLSQQGLFFDNFFANGVRSVEGLASIFSSLPAYDDFTFLMSSFQQNTIISLPQILKKEGYSTTFIHGSFLDSFGIHTYAETIGFEKVLSRDDIEDYEDKSDDAWGVWDEYLFEKVLQEANSQQKPFFMTAFTLSSHKPYDLPNDRFRKFKEPWLNTHHYADWALGKFFAEASKQDWYQNTLFIVVADHTAHGRNHLENAKIPLWIYKPDGSLKNEVIHQVGSQVDILPTLLDLLNLEVFHSSTGKSLLTSSDGFAMYDASVNTWFRSERAYTFLEDRLLGVYNWKIDPDFENPLPIEKLNNREVQSYFAWRQKGHNALITNRIAPLNQD